MKKIILLCLAGVQLFALQTFPVKVMLQQNIAGEFAPVLCSLDVSQAPVRLEIVSQPSNGVLDTVTLSTAHAYYKKSSVRIPWFRYTPQAGFTGRVSFSYRVLTSTETSEVANGTIIVHPPEPGNMTVLVLVCDTLIPRLSTELEQFRSDLESEGYSPRVVSMPRFSQSSIQLIWDTLSAEFDRPGKFLAGAILVGALTNLSQSDRPFWFMSWVSNFAEDTAKYGLMHNWEHRPGNDSLWYDFDANNAKHIWISRLCAYYGEPRTYAVSEADQLKRYFKANHEYRKGITRFPRKAYFHMAYASQRRNYFPDKLMPLFTSVYSDMYDSVAPRDYAYWQSGEILDAQYHGNSSWYHAEKSGDWKGIWTSDIYDYPMSVRFSFTGACNSGGIAGIANSSLYTKNGGCLLAVGATAYAGTGVATFCYKNYADKALSLLASGERWGRVFIRSGAVRNINMGIYGDPTLKPSIAPDNALPVISSLSVDAVSGIAPLTVNFNVSASDTDGSISGYEWYPAGYNYGLLEPSYSGSTVNTVAHTYTKPYRYKARVEVLDNWNARARKTVSIAVSPSCADTLRVNTFAPQEFHYPLMEYTDSTGRLWMHDQLYGGGTWGYQPQMPTIALNANYVPYKARQLATGSVSGTKAPEVFKKYMMPDTNNKIIWYKIPLPNGSFRLNLGFADCRATSDAKKATMAIEVEGEAWRTFCPYDSVGAKVACFIGKDVVVNDGELEFKITTATGSTDTAFLNCFELYSPNPSGCVSSSESSIKTEEDAVALSVKPNPFNPSTLIGYTIPNSAAHGLYKLVVYSAEGKIIRALSSGRAVAGKASVVWNGTDNYGKPVSAGLYIVRLECKSGIKMIRTFLIK